MVHKAIFFYIFTIVAIHREAKSVKVLTSNITTLYNASGFIKLANNVNNGTLYAGTTTLLVNNMDFSGGWAFQAFQPHRK